MNTVEPIRDRKKLEKMKTYLKGKNLRDYCLFVLGINSGLRISDLLKLKIEDVAIKKRNGYEIVDVIDLKEQKTGKLKKFPINKSAKSAIQEYLDKKRVNSPISEPLFKSKKGDKAISRNMAWMVLNEAGKTVGIRDKIGTHTLRKTFGYHAYVSGQDIAVIQKLLNHSMPSITLRYIGITQDELDDVYLNLNL